MGIIRQCCFCFDLKTTGIILGSVGTTIATLLLMTTQYFLSHSQDYPTLIKVPPLYYVTTAILLFAFLIASILLIIGSLKQKKNLVLSWLLIAMLLIIYFTMSLIGNIALISQNVNAALFNFILIILFDTIFIYLWLCIFSLYKEFANANIIRNIVTMQKNELPTSPPYLNLP